MIKVSVFYPSGEGKKFDMDYYCTKHMPMVQQLLGTAVKRTDVEQGLGGVTPGSPPTYAAMCHLYFDSVETFQKAFGPNAKTIMADMPNYTNIQPILQVSEVKIS